MELRRCEGMPEETFRRLTGVRKRTFAEMVTVLELAEAALKKQCGKPNRLAVETRLRMTLEYRRKYRTYLRIGHRDGMSESAAFRTIRWCEDVLITNGAFTLPGKKALLKHERGYAGRLRRLYPGDMSKQLSTEPIYRALYVLPRGALRTELLAALRQARKARRPRAQGRDRRGQIPNMAPITERPADVAARTGPGHWEGDLLKGPPIVRLWAPWWNGPRGWCCWPAWAGTDAVSVYRGFTKKLRHVPVPLRKALTYDRDKEMADHERLAHRLSTQVFFADPHSPRQRGINETTNGLLRQCLPKGTDLLGSPQRELTAIAHRLNMRPRTCLGFATPLEGSAQLRHHSPVALGT